jgi:tetratricopeptide (TPR) repeat protein
MRRPRLSVFALLISTCALPACNRGATPTPPVAAPPVAKSSEQNFQERLPEIMAAHLAGLGRMERFEYAQAADEFRKVHEIAPDWVPGTINYVIALLNDTGLKEEQKKKNRGGPDFKNNFDEALALLAAVLKREPNNPHAHYCRGIILQYQGEMASAHADFSKVTELDPSDGSGWLKAGETLTNPENPVFPAGPKQAKELIGYYTKALERSPYLTSAWYRLQAAHALAGEPAKQRELLARWRALNPEENAAAPGDLVATTYGSMGKYANVIDPFRTARGARDPLVPPKFQSPRPISVELPSGHRWSRSSDFTGKLTPVARFRARFGAAIATFDADGDDKLDLFLAGAVVGPAGVRDALLLNRGEGRFEDASIAFGLAPDRVSLGVAAGDFDADRHIDLFLTGVGDNRLYRNVGSKRFEDVSKSLPSMGPASLSPTARWLDLDQDGDLDLYVVNYCLADQVNRAFTENPPDGVENAAYRNDGVPPATENVVPKNWAPIGMATKDLPARAGLSIAFSAWNDDKAKAFLGDRSRHTAVAALDFDDDRDLDLVLSAERGPLVIAVNDRLGAFHSLAASIASASDSTTPEILTFAESENANLPPAPRQSSAMLSATGLLVADLDEDGKSDLVSLQDDRPVQGWLNRTRLNAEGKLDARFEARPIGGRAWRSALAADVDLDGAIDLLGVSASEKELAPVWARNTVSAPPKADALALGPEPSDPAPLVGLSLSNVAGDALADLLLWRDGQAPLIARNLGNGHHWLALDLGGRWKVGHDRMRTNSHGLGAKLQIQGVGLEVPYEASTQEASTAQSVGPIVFGLGKAGSISLLRVRWPDGVIQCELNQAVDAPLSLAEYNRKTGSCPVLFAWNGERYVCIADFLGGGGLGYLIAPGIVSDPDRDEAVAISADQLRVSDGFLRLSIVEPMDEVAYLDQLRLDVIDSPPGVSVTPDERFAPGGNRPSGRLIAWNREVPFANATDLVGRDLSEVLKKRDRKTADQFRKRDRWVGYAEEHGIVLDFGDRLAAFGPSDRLILRLDGWVEYPYSQTNYAAATAGVKLQPPILERQRPDGSWEVLDSDPGYPAGLPRTTTLELTGKLSGPRCVLRLRTNMECYWDMATMLIAETSATPRVTTLDPAKAVLGHKGYLRETSADGLQPLLYDYDYVDPAPLAKLAGPLTRYGDVRPLVVSDDDQLCLVGPGDELRLDYDARALPALPAGWTRAYVLRSVGYCKDADPATASSDSVLPLPWRGMRAYPFGDAGRRPMDSVYRDYLRAYQTRIVEP